MKFKFFVFVTATLVFLLGCHQDSSTIQPNSSYDFDGVYENTYAGEIDRTVIPRRPDGPPNIVLIIADDLGWPYLGFLGDENVMTPNMDILGRGGAVFELGHATSNHCRPTLQSLITGLHPVQYEQKIKAIADERLALKTRGKSIPNGNRVSFVSNLKQARFRCLTRFHAYWLRKDMPRIKVENGGNNHMNMVASRMG